ncbi:hypothetical protein FGO68_gene4254 [Halteria grandinella]|uniref:RING-type domain-containing protein n=1 Tax=Halteria grandinella TaxID=5974 RepID=A0A8J8TAR6_HALGN|nr:hypothetical protein FGO68_gene4254 [Halteria grandinella]
MSVNDLLQPQSIPYFPISHQNLSGECDQNLKQIYDSYQQLKKSQIIEDFQCFECKHKFPLANQVHLTCGHDLCQYCYSQKKHGAKEKQKIKQKHNKWKKKVKPSLTEAQQKQYHREHQERQNKCCGYANILKKAVPIINDKLMCPQHKGKPIDTYIQTSNQFACTDCMKSYEYQKIDIKPIKIQELESYIKLRGREVLAEKKESNKELLAKRKKMEDDTVIETKQSLTWVNESFDKLIRFIKTEQDETVRKIKERENRILTNLKNDQLDIVKEEKFLELMLEQEPS